MTFRTRFAPSPTGPLHLGHAYSALLAADLAREARGDFLLRIEDIDRSRARDEWEAQIYDDLRWLGLSWPDPVMRQSDHMQNYASALAQLTDIGVIYACTCTRRDIAEAASAPQEGVEPAFGPDGRIYPGTCRTRGIADKSTGALRLDMLKAVSHLQARGVCWPLHFVETGGDRPRNVTLSAHEAIETLGDIVVARREMGTSYHLSVVVDDASQGVTHVTRGADLFDATRIHVVLQKLLDLPTPVYHHHRLIRDEAGKRLAKRDDARAIAAYRATGYTPQDIRALVGL